MFISIERLDTPEVASLWSGQPLAPAPVQPTARGEHARFLNIAAARRLRAMERSAVNRAEDATYWKAIAPAALHRAVAMRESKSFAPLP
ncbi:hypothetical protein BH11PSE2_BH11PSE2_03960 [soil metagenome]